MIQRPTKPIFEKKSLSRRKRLSINGTPIIYTRPRLEKTKVQKMKQTHRQVKQTQPTLMTISPWLRSQAYRSKKPTGIFPKQCSSKKSQEPKSKKPIHPTPERQPPTTLEKSNRSKPLKKVKKEQKNDSNPTLSVAPQTKKTKKTTQIEPVKTKPKTKHMKIINPTHKSKPLVSKVNDTLSDMLTRIRNAQQAKHNTVKIIYTKQNLKIMRLLKNEGFIKQGLRSRPSNKPYIMIYLKYLTADKIPCISKLRRISSPGLRHYVGYKDLPKVLNGMGVSVLTTPQGIMTDKQARRQKVGGELLFEIY
jgi:small subunit ribosomal protein S8